jgi:hypothetical protein
MSMGHMRRRSSTVCVHVYVCIECMYECLLGLCASRDRRNSTACVHMCMYVCTRMYVYGTYAPVEAVGAALRVHICVCACVCMCMSIGLIRQ